MYTLALGAARLTLDDVWNVAHGHATVELDHHAVERVTRVRAEIDGWLGSDAPNVYGVNTGFGALAEVRISEGDLARLQLNLIRSHATGVGLPFSLPIARAMMLLRANVLLLGTSGVRAAVPRLLVEMLARDVVPVVPEKGSVGASGDLAPLAHLALVLVGEGEAFHGGERLPGAVALARAGLTPLALEAKEGLSLINGTQAMTADLALSLVRTRRLCAVADIAGAQSLDALKGTSRAFDARIQAMRAHPGQVQSASNLRRLTTGSGIAASHVDCGKVQDPYSLRCMPQVHGASRDVVTFSAGVVERECNAATDNPLAFETEGGLELLSGGNFHGQPVAFAADFLAIALAELANISERRIEQLVNPALSSGLPAFLAPRSGLNSGFMIAQVTAAALVSENKGLCHPASVDSIPSSANREDHVSMGTIAARKARTVLEHVETVLAIELLCGAQGIDLRRPLRSSDGIEAAHAVVRRHVPPMFDDRVLYPDLEAALDLVRSGAVVDAVEAVIGPLEA